MRQRWAETWLRRLSEKYELPLATVERMPLGAFYREIATMLADAIVREARRLQAKTGDGKERAALNHEYAVLKQSTDWFDRLIVERIHHE